MRGVEITTASGSSRIRSSPTGYVAYLRANGGTLIYLFFGYPPITSTFYLHKLEHSKEA